MIPHGYIARGCGGCSAKILADSAIGLGDSVVSSFAGNLKVVQFSVGARVYAQT